jgi:hypothetical protein
MKRRDTVSTAAMRGDGVMFTRLKRLGKSGSGLLHDAVVADGGKYVVYMTILRFLCYCNDNFQTMNFDPRSAWF